MLGNDYILGAVGVLQFEVTMARLKDEYGVEAIAEGINYNLARWVSCEDPKKLKTFEAKCQGNLAFDAEGCLAFLADGQWRLKHTAELFPEIVFHKTREHN
jgi:peptide chain release factor 3